MILESRKGHYHDSSIIPIENLIRNYCKNLAMDNKFLKKLILEWPKIIEDKKLARYSIPVKIYTENNEANRVILQINAYNGSAALKIQLLIPKIKQNIKFHIGYCAMNDIKVVQKSL